MHFYVLQLIMLTIHQETLFSLLTLQRLLRLLHVIFNKVLKRERDWTQEKQIHATESSETCLFSCMKCTAVVCDACYVYPSDCIAAAVSAKQDPLSLLLDQIIIVCCCISVQLVVYVYLFIIVKKKYYCYLWSQITHLRRLKWVYQLMSFRCVLLVCHFQDITSPTRSAHYLSFHFIWETEIKLSQKFS